MPTETRDTGSRSYVVDFLFCSVIGVLAMLGVLTNSGLPASWDFGAHVATSAKLAIWLRQGVYPLQFPEFWFGYPVLTFYPPVYYLSVALVSILSGVDIYIATKITLTISLVIGAFGAYFAARSAFGDRTASLVAAVSYAFTGYHLRTVIAQGVYPSSFAFMFLPWILAFWYLPFKNKQALYITLAGIFLSLSILSHLLTGLLTAAFFALLGLILAVGDLAVAKPRRAAAKLVSTSAMIVLALGLAAWFLVPMSRYLPFTYLSSGLIGPPQDRGFPQDPHTFIRRNIPIEDLLVRRPIDFAQGGKLPFYIGTVIIALTLAGLIIFGRKLLQNPSKNPGRGTLPIDFVAFNALAFVVSIVFSTNAQLFVLPLWWLNENLSIFLMRIQQPYRVFFLIPMSASMMAGYTVAVLLQSKVAEKLKAVSDRFNLDVNPTKLLAALLIILIILDTSSYAASPFGYYAAYPPYNSEGLDPAYRWLVSQRGNFRIVDPLAGVHSHTMTWDNLEFPGGWSLNPEYYPYSSRNFKTLNITNQLPQNFVRELGYFGVKFAIGHLSDPRRDDAGFAGTRWKPIKQFKEIYVFENPFFRPIAEVVKDPNDLESAMAGNATIDSYRPNYVRIKVASAQKDSFLVFKFFKQPQWYVYVDGTSASAKESEWGFMFLPIGPEAKEVVFTFGSHDLAATTILLATIALVAVVFVVSRRSRWPRFFGITIRGARLNATMAP